MEQKFRCWLFCFIIIQRSHSSDFAQDSSQILSFSFEINKSLDELWKSSNAITNGTRTRLNCITNSPSSTTIRRLDKTDPLSPLNYTEHHVFYDFGNIDCEDMGTYVCEDGQNATRNLDLGILNCEPRLCSDEMKNRTLSVSDEGSKTFSLCFVSYPAVSNVEVLLDTSNGLKTRATAGLSYNYHIEPKTFVTYMLKITLTNIAEQEYGDHIFEIVLLHATQPKKQTLDYRFVLKYDGKPRYVTSPKPASTKPPDTSEKHEGSDSSKTVIIVSVTISVVVVAVVIIIAIVMYKQKGNHNRRHLNQYRVCDPTS